VDAALLLASRVFPEVRRLYPDAELRLVGRNPDPRILALRGPGITVTGKVADMTPHLHAATVYAAPHLTGAGTRTKVLEAMAAGLPIVTTRIGSEGIEATHDREVLIADHPAATVTAILLLLANPAARRRLGTAARRLVEERYDWSRCLAPLETLYSRLLPARAARC
jgi:glycosyltransferase involved in cell wall biosynthesis